MTTEPTCRECGCTDDNACVDSRGPCWWVEADLCSHCDQSEPDWIEELAA